MNWVVVSLNDDDMIVVLGIFDSELGANQWANEAEGSAILLERTYVRPILAANPIEGRQ